MKEENNTSNSRERENGNCENQAKKNAINSFSSG